MIGYLQAPIAMYVAVGLAIAVPLLLSLLFWLLKLCFAASYLRGAMTAFLLGVVVQLTGSQITQENVEMALQKTAGRGAQMLFREYVSPGFVSVQELEHKVKAADHFDAMGMTIIHPSSTPILTPDQVEKALRGIHKLRAFWAHISDSAGPLPMITLGHASYLHGNRPNLNPVLAQEFSWLYDIVIENLEKKLGAKVQIMPGSNLPGFHLYLSSFVWALPVASVHSDLQYGYQESNAKLGEVNVISFTLPLLLPAFGEAGLYTFTNKTTYTPEGAHGLYPREFGEAVRNFHRYTVGELVIHGGVLNHQIAESTMIFPKDGRITLQGHGIFDENRDAWLIYW
ncbi:hypothetical protein AAMO2058_001599100 [Amorphochlora amoebiformis]